MSRQRSDHQPCGCEIVYESISRSNFIRERWGQLCPTHDAEMKAHRAAVAEDRAREAYERQLREEFT